LGSQRDLKRFGCSVRSQKTGLITVADEVLPAPTPTSTHRCGEPPTAMQTSWTSSRFRPRFPRGRVLTYFCHSSTAPYRSWVSRNSPAGASPCAEASTPPRRTRGDAADLARVLRTVGLTLHATANHLNAERFNPHAAASGIRRWTSTRWRAPKGVQARAEGESHRQWWAIV